MFLLRFKCRNLWTVPDPPTGNQHVCVHAGLALNKMTFLGQLIETNHFPNNKSQIFTFLKIYYLQTSPQLQKLRNSKLLPVYPKGRKHVHTHPKKNPFILECSLQLYGYCQKTGTSQLPSREERKNKSWRTHTLDSFSAIARNEHLIVQ